MAEWSEIALFSLEEVGMQVQIPVRLLQFFFFHRFFFYPFAFYCLFSLLTPLASRDFCENVFLVRKFNLV